MLTSIVHNLRQAVRAGGQRMKTPLAGAVLVLVLLEFAVLLLALAVNKPAEARLMVFVLFWGLGSVVLAAVIPVFAGMAHEAEHAADGRAFLDEPAAPAHLTVAAFAPACVIGLVAYTVLFFPARRTLLGQLGIAWDLPWWADLVWLAGVPWAVSALSAASVCALGVKKTVWAALAAQMALTALALGVAFWGGPWAREGPYVAAGRVGQVIALPAAAAALGVLGLVASTLTARRKTCNGA